MGSGRASRGVAVAVLSAPLMALGQLLTGAGRPQPAALLLAVLTVAVVAAALPAGTSWRLAAVTGLAQLGGYAVLAAADRGPAGCLPAVGRGAGALLRLAHPGAEQACTPAGTPGWLVGGALTCVLLAAGILVCHALAAGLAASLLLGLELGTLALAALLRLVLGRLPVPAGPLPAGPATLDLAGAPAPPAARWLARPAAGRGPPTASAASWPGGPLP